MNDYYVGPTTKPASGALSLILEPGITADEVRRREAEQWRS